MLFQVSNKRYFKRADLVAKERKEYREKYGTHYAVENDNTKNIPQGIKFKYQITAIL